MNESVIEVQEKAEARPQAPAGAAAEETCPQTCPVCEGRKVTGRLMRTEDGRCFHGLPLLLCVDRPCGVCEGRGTVDAATYRRWTGGVACSS